MTNRTKTNNEWLIDSAIDNCYTWKEYYYQLLEYATSRYEWVNLPDTVDERFLEIVLNSNGSAVFFNDEEIGYLALQVALCGNFNVYNIPINRRAYAVNGYQKQLTDKNSVIIYNNRLHTNGQVKLIQFANDLYKVEQIIKINANAQKTPLMVLCDDKQRLTLKNLFLKYDGNTPFIFGDKKLIGTDSIKALTTNAPYLCDKLYELKANIWNEALTFLGISNVSINKKERLLTDEVNRLQGGVFASRYSGLDARKQAAKEINKMFNLNIDVKFKNEEYTENEKENENVSDDETDEKED